MDPKPSNLFADCPGLADALPAGVAMATDKERADVQRMGTHRLMVTTISTPILSRDGKSALVAMIHKCVGLCGSGHLVVYKRTKGKWDLSSPTPLVMFIS